MMTVLANSKWMKPTQNILRGKIRNSVVRYKYHFRHGYSKNMARNLAPSLASISSELASVSGDSHHAEA